MRRFSTIIFALGLVFGCLGHAKSELSITTFNIEWFGIGGTIDGTPNDEHRDKHLKQFISKHLMPTDAIVFQEILDLKRLNKILPSGWQCLTYHHQSKLHQHIAICVSSGFVLEKVSYDNNYTIEQVAGDLEKARPAMRVNLKRKLDNAPLITIVGVHLKAFPEGSTERQRQIESIANDLTNNYNLPAVVIGDFNAYPKEKTGSDSDDVEIFESILHSVDTSFKHIAHAEKYTFRNNKNHSQFDQVFLSGNVTTERSPKVFKVCNDPQNSGDFFDIRFYNKNVSDHCPVTVKLLIQ